MFDLGIYTSSLVSKYPYRRLIRNARNCISNPHQLAAPRRQTSVADPFGFARGENVISEKRNLSVMDFLLNTV